MIPIADYHLHTPLCMHATGRPADYAAVAVERGLPEIGFSDHSPMPEVFDDWRMRIEELPRYLDMIAEARSLHPSLPIRQGLEVDWIEGGEGWIESLAGRVSWDYLIGSVHYIGTWNFDHPELTSHFSVLGTKAAWEAYWRLFGDAARSGYFDIMAHPDLIRKFGHRPEGDLRRYYEPAIEAVVAGGCAIEINTAGLHKPCAEMYPAEDFLRLAAEAGVPLTIGSDAHAPEETGRDFAAAAALAGRCGYRQLVRFSGRRRTEVVLPAL